VAVLMAVLPKLHRMWPAVGFIFRCELRCSSHESTEAESIFRPLHLFNPKIDPLAAFRLPITGQCAHRAGDLIGDVANREFDPSRRLEELFKTPFLGKDPNNQALRTSKLDRVVYPFCVTTRVDARENDPGFCSHLHRAVTKIEKYHKALVLCGPFVT